MIYVLILDNGYHQELLDVEEIICCASSKIEDILTYLDENVKVDYVSNYTLVCLEEGASLKCSYGMGLPHMAWLINILITCLIRKKM